MQIRPLTPELLATIKVMVDKADATLRATKARLNLAFPDQVTSYYKELGLYQGLHHIHAIFLSGVGKPESFDPLSFMLDEVTSGSEDNWSGRTNDIKRSIWDGKLDAFKSVHELLKH